MFESLGSIVRTRPDIREPIDMQTPGITTSQAFCQFFLGVGSVHNMNQNFLGNQNK